MAEFEGKGVSYCTTCDGFFYRNLTVGVLGYKDFARKLGVLMEDNAIITDKYQQTNLEGLFAAGDCTGGFKQIATAVGQGAMAGRKVIEYVRDIRSKKDENCVSHG